MPVLFRYKGYRFHFYSNEGNPREPAHVHVQKGREAAKYWLDPVVQLAGSAHMNGATVRELEQIVNDNRLTFLRLWNEYFA